MATLSAAALVGGCQRVVIKIGSALLVQGGALREDWLHGLADDVAALRARGCQVLLVSSGSIALGREVLGLRGDISLEQSQAAAAVGQIQLARAYQEALGPHDLTAAQVLVTLEDSRDRRRYLNSRATLASLLDMGVVPIVNENDTVATDEIRFGDNDRLAAQVAVMAGADLVVLLSDVDGLYTGDPRQDSGAEHMPLVTEITPEIEAVAGGAGSGRAKGGMKTKVMAARTATSAGCALIVARGEVDRPLSAIGEGARATVFAAQSDPATARKGWIRSMKPCGRIVVDAGAARALGSGNSLLPAGISLVEGGFERGDPVEIADGGGLVLGHAISGYDAREVDIIKGHQSGDIERLLGHPGRAVVVHRDDLAI